MQSLVTHHVYDVPLEIATKCCQLADLHQPFGPRFQSFSRRELLRVADEVFGCVPDNHEDLEEEDLLDCITRTAAERQSHQMFVLQLSGNVVQGFVLLVPVTALPVFLSILESSKLRLQH
ncbi:hypothetical protein [Deinococcus cellulosilyticus]|uniref:Uncharacterized protein n=1 Tax=Deinococcus cellulosilyticus (strain DSM 18568 / NBRC 106333 / KACC 11606 / 5516J-15) TaxID=1223518 RepID=A0A511MVD3_DEIC1|nr:hypothetical protein [Deinococcus cellulosilyticus]GEM44539.1 hypothetical protein DC3_01740 [Deinococcus cellulosilyticus NBRC 106333 = KACC 11606]